MFTAIKNRAGIIIGFIFLAIGVGAVALFGTGALPVDSPMLSEIENFPERFSVVGFPATSGKQVAIVKDGITLNIVIVPDGWPNVENPWHPPEGTVVLFSDLAGKGDLYDGEKFLRRKQEF